MGSICKWWISY